MNNIKVLITGDFNLPVYYESFNVVHLRTPNDDDDIIKHLIGVDHYIVGGPEYVNDYILSQAQQLKHIVVMGTAANSFVDLNAAKTKKITVENTPGINADAVAEFALGAIITNLAGCFHSRDELLNGSWYQKPHKTLSEVKLGIIGLGNIGKSLTTKIKAISPSTQILYFSKTRKEDFEKEYGIEFRYLLELPKECDVIVLCLTYNKHSHKIINAQFLNSAKKDLMIFNLSNPLTIDSVDLSNCLQSRIIKFAYFDGYYDEWKNNKRKQFDKYGLLNLGADKFVATSHIAALANHVILEILSEAYTKIKQFRLN